MIARALVLALLAATFQQSTTRSSAELSFPDGRVLMLAVDQASFPPSAARAVSEATERIVAGVPANDYLGAVLYPEWASVVPTRDRQAVRRVLAKIAGVRRDVSPPRYQISAADALLLRSGDATALRTIVTRECESAFNPTCRHEVLQDGSAIAEVLEQQNRSSLTGLFAALDALAAIPERKTLILLSAGLPMTVRPGTRLDRREDVSRLTQMRTVANADLHVVYLNGRFLRHFAPDYRKRENALFDDLRTFGASLQGFAESGGGSFLQMEINADSKLDRLLRGEASKLR